MIVDTLANAPLYHCLGPRVAAGLRYLASFDAATVDGRYAVDGDDVFALVQRYDTAPGAEKRFEAHRRHLDIQFVADGRERILHVPVRGLEVETPYEDSGDVEFYLDPSASSSVLMATGHFAILYPGDAHKPGCMAGGREAVAKVVVKVRL